MKHLTVVSVKWSLLTEICFVLLLEKHVNETAATEPKQWKFGGIANCMNQSPDVAADRRILLSAGSPS